MKAMKSLIAIGGALLVTLAIAGCNTMEGAGEDIEAAGKAVQKAAN